MFQYTTHVTYHGLPRNRTCVQAAQRGLIQSTKWGEHYLEAEQIETAHAQSTQSFALFCYDARLIERGYFSGFFIHCIDNCDVTSAKKAALFCSIQRFISSGNQFGFEVEYFYILTLNKSALRRLHARSVSRQSMVYFVWFDTMPSNEISQRLLKSSTYFIFYER